MRIVIKKSLIHGKGVFANRDFKQGETVFDWSDGTQSLFAKDNLTDEDIQRHIIEKSPAKFVNHSCNPNISLVEGYDVALREIKRGEELTYDYGKEKVLFLQMKCRCGAKNCRGTISGTL